MAKPPSPDSGHTRKHLGIGSNTSRVLSVNQAMVAASKPLPRGASGEPAKVCDLLSIKSIAWLLHGAWRPSNAMTGLRPGVAPQIGQMSFLPQTGDDGASCRRDAVFRSVRCRMALRQLRLAKTWGGTEKRGTKQHDA
jgi:hypothetical protein